MKIETGILQNCVLQRDPSDRCFVSISGTSKSNQSIRVSFQNNSMNPHQAMLSQLIFIDTMDGFQFSGILSGIPTGGPYTVTFTQESNKVCFHNVFVGDIYLLAGQSNMEGVGRMTDSLAPKDMVRCLYMDHHFDVAKDPLHQLHIAKDPVHVLINGGPIESQNQLIGVGPGVSFGQTLHNLLKIPIGLIPCAHGGTTMAQWKPESDSNTTLYGAMIGKFKLTGSHVKGLLWYQGCSDTNEDAAKVYPEEMVQFIHALRSDLDSPDLPVVMAQIGKHCTNGSAGFWNKIQMDQYRLPLQIHNLTVVPTIDLEMDDFIHISGSSQNRLGIRMAKAMAYLTRMHPDYKDAIELIDIKTITYSDNWNAQIILTFKNVIGALKALEKPNGFYITKTIDGAPYNCIFRTELSGNTVILHTTDIPMDINNYYIHYGYGFMPYCNITDSDDRSLPAFTNISIASNKRNLSEPAVTAYLGQINMNAKVPFDPRLLKEYLKETFRKDFYYFLLDPKAHITKEKTVTYHLPFTLSKDADLRLLLGICGTVHISLDMIPIDKKSFTQEHFGPDQSATSISIKEGIHLLSLDCQFETKGPKGIFCRFEGAKGTELPIWINTIE